MRYEAIPVHKIVLPARLHRITLDEERLQELIASIRDQGLHEPIIVTTLADHYQLEAGHRRLIAHQRLNRTTIEAKIYEPGDQVNGEAVRFAENLQRADLSPMEEALAIQGALEQGEMTTHDIARMVNRTETWVLQRLSLLELSQELGDLVHQKRLSIGAALELGKVTDDQHRAYLLRYCVDSGASVAVVRDWVRQWELAVLAGDGREAPRPEMLLEGQPVIIQIPCYVCGTAHEHTTLRILRVCPRCAHELAGVGVAGNDKHPTAPAPS